MSFNQSTVKDCSKHNNSGVASLSESSKYDLIIEAKKTKSSVDWAELWEYRELLYFLVWRDIRVRYKQTTLGVLWVVLQPILSTFIFTIIFGKLAKLPSDGLPYPVFVYAGLLPWTFFSNGVLLASQSLINQQNLLTKIYFPRLFVPTASVGAGLVDTLVCFVLYAVILVCFKIPATINLLALPILLLLTIFTTLGMSYLLAALTVTYRDIRFVIPFMLQVLLYASPVVYPVSMVPASYQWMLSLNPLSGIIDGYRSALLGKPWNWDSLLVSSTVAIVLLQIGVAHFKMTERKFADIA